ncbi:hypothetical protein ACFE04_024508 [Oxalis oulophora]
MANPNSDDNHKKTLEPQTPLLNNNKNKNPHQQQQQQQGCENVEQDSELDITLSRLEGFLTILGFFSRSSVLSLVMSWFVFVSIGVALPVLILQITNCSTCQSYQIKSFELEIVASQACLAAASLLCLSHSFRKYGLRNFLFVDRYAGQMPRFRDQYINQIQSRSTLAFFMLQSVKNAILDVVQRAHGLEHDPWWLSIIIIIAMVLSWTYLSMISLTASILFHLLCNLQVIHFDDYAKLLERESDVLLYIEEHIRLRYHLSKISHRFRIFLILYFVVVTASQFVTLLQTTGYKGMVTIINGGDFAVSSIVQVVGIIICLHAATKISHRAQGIATLASKWHALVTCGPSDSSQIRGSPSLGNLESANASSNSILHVNYSESDLESFDYAALPTNYVSTYHKRQAFVMYLQGNPGGITIFGWTVDRGLLNTIFFIELSLVTFVLGKTIRSSIAPQLMDTMPSTVIRRADSPVLRVLPYRFTLSKDSKPSRINKITQPEKLANAPEKQIQISNLWCAHL